MDVTIASLNMGVFTPEDEQEISSMQNYIDLNKPGFIKEFGDIGKAATLDSMSNMLEDSPVSALASRISQIIAKLREADPAQVTVKPSWIQRFLGKSTESKLLYQIARKSLDTLIQDASKDAERVERAIEALDALLRNHQNEVRVLRMSIAAGRLFMAANPDAGKPIDGELAFDNQRERFARKLTNMAALLASHEMGFTQLRLTRASAIDLLDRFQEVSRVLVPVWRQHSMALINNTKNNPEVFAAANKAHEALMTSLTQMKSTEEI
ncbi:MAG TPA: toxic anion resistance protein [Methylobacter sp.]|jgi:hypothetical protein